MPRHSVQLTVLDRLGELLMNRHSVQLTVLDSG